MQTFSALLRGVLLLVMFLSTALFTLGASAQSSDGLVATIGVSNCPDIVSDRPDETANLSTCLAGEGVTISASTTTGQDFGSCETVGSVVADDGGSYASCEIPVPDGLTAETKLVFDLDYRDVPDGYNASIGSGTVTVAELTASPGTLFRFYNPATPPPGPTEPPGYPITTFVCDTDPGPWSPFSAREIGGGCVRSGGISVTASLEDGTILETCTTNDRGTCYLIEIPGGVDLTLIFTEDETTLPEGYVARDNPQTGTNYSEFKGTYFVNLPVNAPVDAAPNENAPAEPTETLTDETDGSTVAIYAGDCEGDFADEPVATLTNVRPPDGEAAGADTASAVETSFTTLDLPLDDLLAEDHVLVVFDEDDDTVPLACGAIGGIITEDGSLVFGLPAVGASRFSGVAYLTEDGDQTLATLFLAEDLDGGDETPAA